MANQIFRSSNGLANRKTSDTKSLYSCNLYHTAMLLLPHNSLVFFAFCFACSEKSKHHSNERESKPTITVLSHPYRPTQRLVLVDHSRPPDPRSHSAKSKGNPLADCSTQYVHTANLSSCGLKHAYSRKGCHIVSSSYRSNKKTHTAVM